MLNFIHGYHPELWDAQINSGLVNPGDGIRFCQSKLISEHMKFNSLAAKGTPLYRYLAENPFTSTGFRAAVTSTTTSTIPS